MNININRLIDVISEADGFVNDSDRVNVVRDALLEEMQEAPLFALAVLLAAREYNN